MREELTMDEAWQAVRAAHRVKWPDGDPDTLGLEPRGGGDYAAYIVTPDGRMEAQAGTATNALDALALDISGASDESRRDTIRRREYEERKRRGEAEAAAAQADLDALPRVRI